MQNAHYDVFQSRLLKPLALGVLGIGLAYVLSRFVLQGELTDLVLPAVAGIALAFLIANIKDWRIGIYCFFVWLIFEDLIRKFTGNGTAMFFAKDALLAVTYFFMVLALIRQKLPAFKPPFFVLLNIFFWFGVLQIFNPNSPSVLYGLLGLKMYFFYVPLMYAGYALLQTEKDLHRILMLNMGIACVVAGLGIAQSILGLSFLNPTELDPNLQALGHDIRMTPFSHLQVQRGTSVYVSEGRYGTFLAIFYILALATAVYLLMRTKRGRKLTFPALGLVVLGTAMAGIRTPFVALLVSTLVLMVGFFWGAPPMRSGQTFSLAKAVRLGVVFAALAIITMTLLFPDAIAARWAMYSETLNPESAASELGTRSWSYSEGSLMTVFSQPNWHLGNGIGTASIGRQYVSKLLGRPNPPFGVENGFGTLIVEFGIVGPFLWALWVGSLLYWSFRTVLKLKGTRFFPLAFAFTWLEIYVLLLTFFYSSAGYQDYLANAYLWLSIGMLFRLPGLLAEQKAPAASVPAYADRT